MRFSDAHCHVHLRSYNWLRHLGQSENENMFHPWVIILSNDRKREKCTRASHYGQSDMVKLYNGNVRLVFNVLYPLEKEFFGRDVGSCPETSFMSMVGKILNKKNSVLRDLVQGYLMDVPLSFVNYMKSLQYDYWEELKGELRFALSKNGLKTENKLFPPAWRRVSFRGHKKRKKQYPAYYQAEGTFYYPKNKEELAESIQKENEITMLLTIEGAHALGSDTASIDVLLERIDELRSWEQPILFITFAHHFNNKLCGHARSLPKIATYLYNQFPGMNEGINENGFKVIRKLLMLDNDNHQIYGNGYRILIDIKHMAARSRKDYYEQIIQACFRKGDVIPVIASHCGYSGGKSLDELIKNQEQESYDLCNDSHFNTWSINLCDEDIKMIFKTRGIFGLCFDQRIMGLENTMKHAEKPNKSNIQAIWHSLEAAVKVVYEWEEIKGEDKIKIWDCICLGSDFDGYIDPVSPYPTAVEFNRFAEDLKTLMLNEQQKANSVIEPQMNVHELLEKICYKNLESFALKHFPR